MRMTSTASRTLLRTLLPVLLSVLLHARTAPAAQTKKSVDLLIRGGLLVSMDPSRHLYNDGAVAISGDSIVAVGPRQDIESQFSAKQTIDAHDKLIMPGFINGHTHVPMTLLRGLHDDVTLDDWLRKYIFPAEAKNVN